MHIGEPITYVLTFVPVFVHIRRAVHQEDLTTMCHQIFMKIQELVSDFFRTWTFAFVILEIEEHIDLKVWNKKEEEQERERSGFRKDTAKIVKTKDVQNLFLSTHKLLPNRGKSILIIESNKQPQNK